MSTEAETPVPESAFLRETEIDGQTYRYVSLKAAAALHPGLERLPKVLKILAESTLRHAPEEMAAYTDWLRNGGRSGVELQFRPERVVTHDSTCIAAFVDFATMRDKAVELGLDPWAINPRIPVEVVIDHSVTVDYAGTPEALEANMVKEIERNGERYELIRWAEKNLDNVEVTPPGFGIVHQVNLERLAKVVRVTKLADGGPDMLVPDTLVGADSHTPMINGLSVLAWGVGGVEMQIAALAKPLPMVLPAVLGIRIFGVLRPGVTAADLAYTMVDTLRRRGVIDHMLEFFGPGVASLSVADRATLANMVPEYGATTGFFPIDRQTIDYLALTGRDTAARVRIEAYAKLQGLWGDEGAAPFYTDTLDFDLASVETSLAGPSNPAERVVLRDLPASVRGAVTRLRSGAAPRYGARADEPEDGAVLIAAITSCTTTANPRLMMGAGLLARKARQRGLDVPWWVKTSLSPGSRPTARYLSQSGLQDDLDGLGFHVTGFGCMTCIGNSGELSERVNASLAASHPVGTAVLSGNRNFEGRIHPDVKAAYLATPALVVAYALAGTTMRNLETEPLGIGSDGRPVMLHEIWPSGAEIDAMLLPVFTPALFALADRDNAASFGRWEGLSSRADGAGFAWDEQSDYLRSPPFLEGMDMTIPEQRDITGARLLVMVGDRVSTDHISPASSISPTGVAGQYLLSRGVARRDFNQFSARRGNHEVMMRGGFSNAGLINEVLADIGKIGGFARVEPEGEVMPVYDAAMRQSADGVPLIVIGGKEYGTGSSRDWAAKVTALLGVRAVIAENFERIHRSNLIALGVMPLEFPKGMTRHDLMLTGRESFDILGLDSSLAPRREVTLVVHRLDGRRDQFPLVVCIDTRSGIETFMHGGVLRQTIRELAAATADAA